MPVMTGNRDDVVRTTQGHTIKFTEGNNSFVPDTLVKQCLDRGHRLAVKAEPNEEPKVTVPEPQVEAPKAEAAPKPKPKPKPTQRTRGQKPAPSAQAE